MRKVFLVPAILFFGFYILYFINCYSPESPTKIRKEQLMRPPGGKEMRIKTEDIKAYHWGEQGEIICPECFDGREDKNIEIEADDIITEHEAEKAEGEELAFCDHCKKRLW